MLKHSPQLGSLGSKSHAPELHVPPPQSINKIQSIVPGFLEKCNHANLLRCACANKPGEQAPPPFIGGAVPTHKPLAASGKVLGTDFTDLLIRLVVNKEAAPVRDIMA